MDYTIFDQVGNILCNYTGTRIEDVVDLYNGFGYVPGTYVATEYYYDIVNNSIQQKSPRPSLFHTHNPVSNGWDISSDAINTAKIIKCNEITAKANELHLFPITYDLKLLDADVTAQQNISGKIIELQNNIALSITSTNLFWRDANNNDHTWTDAAEYLTWLQGLFNAITTRRTNLYALSWQGKAAINAMTTIEEIQNFDVNALFAN